MASVKLPIQLILDFDGTITTSDTTAVIGSRLLARTHDDVLQKSTDGNILNSMQYYSERYMQEYRAWQKSFVWPYGERETVNDEVSYLSQSRSLEQNSFLRVREGIMKGSTEMVRMENNESARNDLMRGIGRQAVRCGEVNIRDRSSLEKLIARAEEEGSVWGIVSVSWSRQFILGVLLEANLVRETELDTVAEKIRCNEILAPPRYLDEGNLDLICTAIDKKAATDDLLTHRQQSRGDRSSQLTIYVGDSSTDIGCLASSAYGMYFSVKENVEDDSVVQTLRRLGVQCLTTDDRRQVTPPDLVYVIKDFNDLYEWIASQG